MNYLLIPLYGYEGSSMITLIVYFYMCLFAFITGKKHYPINYDIKKLASYLIIMLVLLLIGWNTNHPSKVISQLLKEIPVLIFIIMVLVVERKKLRLSKN